MMKSGIFDIEQQKNAVHILEKYDMLSRDDAINIKKMTDRNERNMKKQAVDAVHKTINGEQRTIKYLQSKSLYQTIMADKSRITAKTLDDLYDKLFVYYNLAIDSTVLSEVFKRALDEKAQTENNSLQTITRYEYDFKRSISADFAKRDIKQITKQDLKAYTQSYVNSSHPTRKSFLAYKGVLNLIFDYAVEHDIIATSPVSAIRNSVYLKSCVAPQNRPEDKIFSTDEINIIKKKISSYMTSRRYDGYFINGYAMLLAIETGMRSAELCALKWTDIDEANKAIHIHAQQLSQKPKGAHKKEYIYAEHTKDEKGVSKGGRYFPLTVAIKAILDELRALQTRLNISSEFIFCHEDGDWIKTDAYETCLRRLCRNVGLNVTNNHAFRMSLNSNVFISQLNLPVTERARLLGHSVETNLRHYSYAAKNNLCDIRELLNKVSPSLT